MTFKILHTPSGIYCVDAGNEDIEYKTREEARADWLFTSQWAENYSIVEINPMSPAEIQAMARSNAYGALDMRSTYDSVREAVEQYRINVGHTLQDIGIDTEENRTIAFDAYDLKVRELFPLLGAKSEVITTINFNGWTVQVVTGPGEVFPFIVQRRANGARKWARINAFVNAPEAMQEAVTLATRTL